MDELSSGNQQPDPSIRVAHYCVAFFDLLGQKASLGNSTLLPPASSPVERKKFIEVIRNSIGAISLMQGIAENLRESLKPREHSPLKASLPKHAQKQWDEMQKDNVQLQRWSDGLLLFSCLGDREVKCNVVGIFQLFIVAGGVLFLTLAGGRPVRGAIEIAWGAELHPGELYGAAIAETYRLENTEARFPRIVIGNNIIEYLEVAATDTTDSPYIKMDASLAKKCLRMIGRDSKSIAFLDYLGEAFSEAAPLPRENLIEVYETAVEFSELQRQLHSAQKNKVLADRYVELSAYLKAAKDFIYKTGSQ